MCLQLRGCFIQKYLTVHSAASILRAMASRITISSAKPDLEEDVVINRLPTEQGSLPFGDWNIKYSTSHILKSVCSKKEEKCSENDPDCCELCLYQRELDIPHLPDMVFHQNILLLVHSGGAKMEFNAIDALRRVTSGSQPFTVAYASAWREGRSSQHLEEKVKPFDWTYTTDYEGTVNGFKIEETDEKLNRMKLMKKEKILFYDDFILYEDELHDNGVAKCSVKIRVMPSGFFILLRFFLRIDRMMIKMHDTRFYYEVGNLYIFKEVTIREAKMEQIPNTVEPSVMTLPHEIEKFLPVLGEKSYKMYFT